MFKTTTGLAAVAAWALLTPAEAAAYGAAHVGYTHVGPQGVYHAGATETAGGGYHYEAGGAAYHTGTTAAGGAYHTNTDYRYGGTYGAGGAAYGGYHYDTHTGTAGDAYHYSYVR